MMGFVVDVNGTGAMPFDGAQAGSALLSGLEPGTLKVLPSGFDVKFSTPQQSQAGMDLAKASLQSIAAGIGVPCHLVGGSLADANYSSLRTTLVDFRRRVETFIWHCMVPQVLDPIWRRWVALEMLAGPARRSRAGAMVAARQHRNPRS